MKRLAIIGSGDLGQLIAYHAYTDKHYEVVGFFDDFRRKGEVTIGFPIIGKLNDVLSIFKEDKFDCILIAIGYKHFASRKNTYLRIKDHIPLGKIVHSSAYVAASCVIGNGVVILPGCNLDNNVVIEDNVFINTAATIAHDTKIKAHSFISPAVAIAGFVTVGECCNIGINSTIIDNITIADSSQTGGGAVVINNIDVAGVYVGVPAKILK